MKRSENAMGLGPILIFFALAFIISHLLLTLNVASKGGFDWVLKAGTKRNLLIGLGWLAFVIAPLLSHLWHVPQFLR